MRIIKNITEDEMIATFLRAEIDSPRFRGKIIKQLRVDHQNRKIIDEPDFSSQKDNAYRKLLLGEYREYNKNKGLFESFPKNVSWSRAILNKKEVKRLKYIDYDYWVKLSGGSRFAKDGARSVIAGIEVFKQSNKNFWEAVQHLKQGKTFVEPIIVALNKNADLVILEGHLRLTAYFMAPNYMPTKLQAIIGFSESLNKWDLY